MTWIQSQAPTQITDQIRLGYYCGVDMGVYAETVDSEKGVCNPAGITPPSGP